MMQPGSSSAGPSAASGDASGSSKFDGDGSAANGASTSTSSFHTNSTSASRAAFSNGHENGNGHADLDEGASTSVPPHRLTPLYPGSTIDREELVRLTLQCLQDAGYAKAANTLSMESGVSLESPTITAFRDGVLAGKWESVSRILQDGLIVQGEAATSVRFLIAEQKFLEHLEARETKKALSTLRNELAPLNHDPDRLHQLSSFMMCAVPDELRERSGWLGAGDASRKKLLEDLQQYIPSTTMIPQRRLETLLEQAKEYQRIQCRYHAADPPISLFSDHLCDRGVFPTVTTHILGGHEDEVWRVEFSNKGDMLASASQDGRVLIWQVADGFALLHTIHAAEHMENITCLAWSPDDTMLLLGVETSIKLYDVLTGRCILNVIKHEDCAIGGVAWLPNSKGFFSGGLDMRLLCWDLDGNLNYAFSTAPYRIFDVAVAPDASRLVCLAEASHVHKGTAASQQVGAAAGGNNGGSGANVYGNEANRSLFEVKDRRIIIFNLNERRQERFISHPTSLTCATFAPDNPRYILVNQAPDEIVLYDVVTGADVKRYHGQKQGMHMIRSCFGGSSHGFVISGSEDSMIYVWHKDNGIPLECLAGHGPGSVNDVAWNPSNAGMFASASDDHTIRIWQAPLSMKPPHP